MAREVGRSIEAVWRIESDRIVASVARLVRDVSLVEDLAQEALIAALETWPGAGKSGEYYSGSDNCDRLAYCAPQLKRAGELWQTEGLTQCSANLVAGYDLLHAHLD